MWANPEEVFVLTSQPAQVQEALALEARAKAIIEAALQDEQFMNDVREAQALEQTGSTGEPWARVKVRLGLLMLV